MSKTITTKPTIDEIIGFLDEWIESIAANIRDSRRTLGKNFDQNSYGAGYHEGELSAFKYTKAFVEALEDG